MAVFSMVKAKIKQQLPKVNAGNSQRKQELLEIVWKTLSETNSLDQFTVIALVFFLNVC